MLLAQIPDATNVLNTAAGRSDSTYLAVAVMVFAVIVMFGVGWFLIHSRRETEQHVSKACASIDRHSESLDKQQRCFAELVSEIRQLVSHAELQ